MAELNKLLDIWADKLLDTGKRNNLINFKDSKVSSAEVVFPVCSTLFSKCSVGTVFTVYDPKIEADDLPDEADEDHNDKEKKQISRDEYIAQYSRYIKKDTQALIYAQTPNPMTAVKNMSHVQSNNIGIVLSIRSLH